MLHIYSLTHRETQALTSFVVSAWVLGTSSALMNSIVKKKLTQRQRIPDIVMNADKRPQDKEPTS